MQLVSTLEVVSAPAEIAKLASVVIWPQGRLAVSRQVVRFVYLLGREGQRQAYDEVLNTAYEMKEQIASAHFRLISRLGSADRL